MEERDKENSKRALITHPLTYVIAIPVILYSAYKIGLELWCVLYGLLM